MKYIYIVDHFCPFPTSEYGGIWVVVAENDNECYDLIADWDNDWNVDYYPNITKNIQKSVRLPLFDEQESRVVESFTT